MRAIRLPGGGLSRGQIDKLAKAIAPYGAKGLAWAKLKEDGSWQSPIGKFLSDELKATISERMPHPMTADPRWTEVAMARIKALEDHLERRKKLEGARKEKEKDFTDRKASPKKPKAAKKEPP